MYVGLLGCPNLVSPRTEVHRGGRGGGSGASGELPSSTSNKGPRCPLVARCIAWELYGYVSVAAVHGIKACFLPSERYYPRLPAGRASHHPSRPTLGMGAGLFRNRACVFCTPFCSRISSLRRRTAHSSEEIGARKDENHGVGANGSRGVKLLKFGPGV